MWHSEMVWIYDEMDDSDLVNRMYKGSIKGGNVCELDQHSR